MICVRGSRSVSNDHVNLDEVSVTGQLVRSKFFFILLSNADLQLIKPRNLLSMCNIDFVLLSIYDSLVPYVFNLSFYNIIW